MEDGGAQSQLLPQSTLRKSLSVDSFVQYSPNLTTRASRGNTNSAIEPPRSLVFDVSAGLRRQREQQTAATRARGASVSSVKDEAHISDSDVDRIDSVVSSPTDPFRPISLKSQEQPAPLIRGGDLPLPARTPTLSTTSSLSSIVTASTSASTQDGVSRVQSTSSLQTTSRKTPAVIAAGRARSGSLGVYAPPSTSRRMVINTQVNVCALHLIFTQC
jgi:hypothetical protein